MVEMTYILAGAEHHLTVPIVGQDAETAATSLTKPINLALVVDGPVLLLLARLAAAPDWQQAAFFWHHLPPRARPEPAWPAPLDGAKLRLSLVDAATGAPLAERTTRLPPGFTELLHGAIRHQARGPALTTAEFERAVDRLLVRHTGPGLVRQAIARATV